MAVKKDKKKNNDKKKIKNKKAEEELIKGLEDFAAALVRGEDVTKTYTCRKVLLDLQPIQYSPDMVREVRATVGVSQSLFAQYIGVSLSNLQKWERGERKPSRMACRFMDELMSDPKRAKERFLTFAKPAKQTAGA